MTDSPTLTRLADAVLQPGFAGTSAPDWVRRRVADGLGSVILFAGNVESPEQVRTLTDALRKENADLLIAVDEEGGDITRLDAAEGSSYPGNLALGTVDDTDLTEAVLRSVGARLRDAGIDLDYAPVADVNTNPRNPVIGTRSFGADPQLVSAHVAAAVRGLHGVGIAACAKHFPGHGDTDTDSHFGLPKVTENVEIALEPFLTAIDAGVRAVMVGHLLVPAFDTELPASISPLIIGEVLRERLGFDGLAVSDGIAMAALRERYGVEGATVRALAAGIDLVCVDKDTTPEQYDALRRAIAGAVRDGSLTEERLVEAAARVADFVRWQRGLAPGKAGPAVGAEAARRAVRILRAQPGALPLRGRPNVVELGCALRADLPGTPAADGPLVVVVRNAHLHPDISAQAQALIDVRADAVVLDLGVPVLDLGGAAWVAAYGASRACAEAAVAAITRD